MFVDPCRCLSPAAPSPPIYKVTKAFHDLFETEKKYLSAQTFSWHWMAGKEKLKGIAGQLSFCFSFQFLFHSAKKIKEWNKFFYDTYWFTCQRQQISTTLRSLHPHPICTNCLHFATSLSCQGHSRDRKFADTFAAAGWAGFTLG